MPHVASNHAPRASKAKGPTGANGFATSNTTSSLFLGSAQREWMRAPVSPPLHFFNQQSVQHPTIEPSLMLQTQSQILSLVQTAQTETLSSNLDDVRQRNNVSDRETADHESSSTQTAEDNLGPSQRHRHRGTVQTQSIEMNDTGSRVPTDHDRSWVRAIQTQQASQTILTPDARPGSELNVPASETASAHFQTFSNPQPIRFSSSVEAPTTNLTAQAMANGSSTLISLVAPTSSRPGSKKRFHDTQDRQRRVRQRSDGEAAMQIPTPNSTPSPSFNTLGFGLQASVERVRKQKHLLLVEEQRLSLLYEACRTEDLFYLYLHQLFCLWTANVNVAVQLGCGAGTQAGLRILEPIMVPNSQISPEILILFAKFPHSDDKLQDLPGLPVVQQVRRFLIVLGAQWATFCQTCQQRGHPPCAQELFHLLFLPSLVMQKTLFNSLHRHVSGADNLQWQRAALDLFEQDQLIWRERLAAPDPTNQRSQAFGQAYKQLRDAIEGSSAFASWPGPVQGAAPLRVSQPLSIQGDSLLHGSNAHAPRPPQFTPQSSINTFFILPSHSQLPMSAHQSGQVSQTSPSLIQQESTLPHQASLSGHTLSRVPTAAHSRNLRDANPGLNLSAAPPPPPSSNFLPPQTFQMPHTAYPNTDRIALHQAHLCSPKFRIVDAIGNDMSGLRLYQYPREFSLDPQVVNDENAYVEWHFNVPPDAFLRLAKFSPPEPSSTQKHRLLMQDSTLLRLRCISRKLGVRDPSPGSQFTAEPTSWPQCCFVSLNDHADLELRRRSHHGRDLPVDLTDLVRPGENTIRVSFHWTTSEADKQFIFAVEVVQAIDQASVMSLVERVSKLESLTLITSALKCSGQDDDLIFVDQSITIDLIDPFMATIWQTPVRGKTCLHRECFDLEAFLQSRTSRQKDGPTNPDEWKCPICKMDARPPSLVIDEFLLEVRDSLEQANKLDAKAISVKQDGTWEPKLDGESGGGGADMNATDAIVPSKPDKKDGGADMATVSTAGRRRPTPNSKNRPPVFIDLDGM